MIDSLVSDWHWVTFLPAIILWTGIFFIHRENKETRRLENLGPQFQGLGFVKVSWNGTTCDLSVIKVKNQNGQLIVVARRTFVGSFSTPPAKTCDWDWHAYDGSHIFSARGAEWPQGSFTVVGGDLTLELPVLIMDDGCLRPGMEPRMERPEPKAV